MDIYILVKIKTEWTLVHRAKIFIDAIHFIIWTRPAVIQELSENIDFEIKRADSGLFLNFDYLHCDRLMLTPFKAVKNECDSVKMSNLDELVPS